MEKEKISSWKEEIVCHLEALGDAIRFLTIIPLPVVRKMAEPRFDRTLCYFSLTGSLIGGCLYLVLLVGQALPNAVLAALLVVLMSAVSGFLHMDGLADSADAFLSHKNKQDCLVIMKDSQIGVMGTAAIGSVFLIKYAVFSSLDRELMTAALFVAPVAGRTAITLVMAVLPYARKEGGLGSLFYSGFTRKGALINALYLVGLSVMVQNEIAEIVLIAVIITVLLVSLVSRSKIGGATGDTLGAVCELTETAVLICFSLCC